MSFKLKIGRLKAKKTKNHVEETYAFIINDINS